MHLEKIKINWLNIKLKLSNFFIKKVLVEKWPRVKELKVPDNIAEASIGLSHSFDWTATQAQQKQSDNWKYVISLRIRI